MAEQGGVKRREQEKLRKEQGVNTVAFLNLTPHLQSVKGCWSYFSNRKLTKQSITQSRKLLGSILCRPVDWDFWCLRGGAGNRIEVRRTSNIQARRLTSVKNRGVRSMHARNCRCHLDAPLQTHQLKPSSFYPFFFHTWKNRDHEMSTKSLRMISLRLPRAQYSTTIHILGFKQLPVVNTRGFN